MNFFVRWSAHDRHMIGTWSDAGKWKHAALQQFESSDSWRPQSHFHGDSTKNNGFSEIFFEAAGKWQHAASLQFESSDSCWPQSHFPACRFSLHQVMPKVHRVCETSSLYKNEMISTSSNILLRTLASQKKPIHPHHYLCGILSKVSKMTGRWPAEHMARLLSHCFTCWSGWWFCWIFTKPWSIDCWSKLCLCKLRCSISSLVSSADALVGLWHDMAMLFSYVHLFP